MNIKEATVRHSVELLLPSVQWGNVKLIGDVTLKADIDNAKEVKQLSEMARKMAIEELKAQKADVDTTLEASAFQLEKFTK